MTILSAADLAKSYGPTDIFRGLSLSIPPSARIAIVGPNGIGKTTLLRILVGLEEPTSGSLQRARSLNVGYLPQEAILRGKHTLWDECLQAFENLLAMEIEMRQLEAAMSDPEQSEAALERYARLQPEFERIGGYTYETRIRQTMSGLGFEKSDYQRPIQQLSGGQRTRAALARLLLSNPDLLVLDEPTNHLDIHAVEWLEGTLRVWEGTVLIVSHDRYFLDRVVDTIWELGANGLEVYRGNYSAYVQQRQDRWDRRLQIFETEKKRLEKELDYIKRNISGQNVSQAKGKLRRLSREVQAIEKLGVEALQDQSWMQISSQIDISNHPLGVEEVERRTRALREPSNRPPHLHLKLKTSQRSGDLVLRTLNVSVGYADEGRPLFQVPDLLLKRTDCAALIGPNGAGKTTFLRTILGQMPPLAGEVVLGASLEIGYFAQAHEDLNPERTLMEEIETAAPKMLPGSVRDYLARFLFSGDEVFKKVSTLSGGERGRLALAKLSLTQANLLLLDEPTNHLDIPSQEILQEVLSEFPGTILLVSHDRYLIDALASQIWEILPGEAVLNTFEGSYTQYKAMQEAEGEKAAKIGLTQENVEKKVRPASSKSSEKRRTLKLRAVEEEIATLEKELADLSRRLENPPADMLLVQKLGTNYTRCQAQIEKLMHEWEALHEQMETPA